ncbi:hypothetical protein ABZW02_37050 [Streptomyces sp. NPDC005180]|uniref:hypothetical protein n=1 Tax=Streptomyces sp. NPDC005180 TaxID=3156868 RepID=UPI0033ADB2C4
MLTFLMRISDDVGEGPQLGGGPGEFSGQPHRTEGGLGVGGLDDVLAGLVEEVRAALLRTAADSSTTKRRTG